MLSLDAACTCLHSARICWYKSIKCSNGSLMLLVLWKVHWRLHFLLDANSSCARRLYITGHSLGGGLAKLVAANVSIPVGNPRTQSVIGDNRCIGRGGLTPFQGSRNAYTGIKCNKRTPSRENKLFQIATAKCVETLETVIFVSKSPYGLWVQSYGGSLNLSSAV